jgi:hypothetical protein
VLFRSGSSGFDLSNPEEPPRVGRIFIYKRNIERVAAGLFQLDVEIARALEAELLATFASLDKAAGAEGEATAGSEQAANERAANERAANERAANERGANERGANEQGANEQGESEEE